jgi:hypothetical protein
VSRLVPLRERVTRRAPSARFGVAL